MDGVSTAASIIAIASAGVQISIKLIGFASQVRTAQKTINAIGNDVSLTSGVLHELAELMKKKKPDQEVSIFSDGALRITQSSARTCQGIFEEIEAELKKASRQVSGKVTVDGGMLVPSHAERMKWPFLQPGIEGLRAELEKSKGTLMLVLQVTTPGYTEALAKANKPANMTVGEKEQLIHAIEALEKTVRGQKRRQASGGISPQSSVRRLYDHNDNKQGLTETHQSEHNLPTRNHVQSMPTNPIRVPASAEASKQGSLREEEEERSACGDTVNQPKGGADIVTQTTKQYAQNRDLLTDAKLKHISNRLVAEPPSDAVSDKG
ncbi:MAG: hypothetical protein M1830_010852 [Pleopsidium flavum]|nr:MAG: hypothetical protein M1830_010852 [Pleopsidium flavum]